MKKNSKHIVFGEFSKSILINSKELNIDSESIISLNDDLSVGPIYKLNTELGKAKRLNWLKSILKDTLNANYIISQVSDDISKIESLRHNIKDGQELYIWSGKYASEKLSTSRLLYELQDLNITCYSFDISNIKLKSFKGTYFSPYSLKVVNPEQVHLLTKSFQRIQKNDYIIWNSLWKKTIDTKEIFRILLDEETILNENEYYFDNTLKSNCTVDLLGASRIIGKTLVDLDFKIPDWILTWRLKRLAEMKKIETKGKLKDRHDFSVKITPYNIVL